MANPLIETVREALLHLRFSNAQPNLRASWDAKDARAALACIEALLAVYEEVAEAAELTPGQGNGARRLSRALASLRAAQTGEEPA